MAKLEDVAKSYDDLSDILPQAKPGRYGWAELLQQIEDMLDNEEEYGYAADTLEGIGEYVKANMSYTDKQLAAVNNISAKPSSQRWHGKRRF